MTILYTWIGINGNLIPSILVLIVRVWILAVMSNQCMIANLNEFIPDILTHDVDDSPAVGGKELVRPLIKGNHLGLVCD